MRYYLTGEAVRYLKNTRNLSHVTPDMLRTWRVQGRIQAERLNETGKPVYRFSQEALDTADLSPWKRGKKNDAPELALAS